MKKFTLILSAVLVALSINARGFEGKSLTLAKNVKTAELRQLDATPSVKKAPAALLDEEWVAIGDATVTEAFWSIFSYPAETYECSAFKSATTAGLYAISNVNDESGTSVIEIHAEDPELVYILKTKIYSTDNYGDFSLMSKAGYYMASGYSADVIISYLGNGTDVWGKKVKNVISFAGETVLFSLSGYNNGNAMILGEPLIIELPDLEAPVITAVNNSFVGATKAIIEIVADDDADEMDDLTFTVKNGDDVLAEDGKTSDGKLTIDGLTKNTEYSLSLIATDRAGHSSEAFAFSFTTVDAQDEVAPTLVKAEIKEVSDKWATITGEASDNERAVEDIKFVVTFADESSIELAANDGAIKLEGLTPETAYAITVAAKDIAGNISDAIALNFTTLEIIPIELTVVSAEAKYYGGSNGKYNFWLNLYGEKDNNYLPDIYIDVYAPQSDKLSGEYSVANGGIQLQYTYLTLASGKVTATDAYIKLVFVEYYENFPVYTMTFSIMGADGNLYIGTLNDYIYITDSNNNALTNVVTGESVTTAIDTINADTKAVKRVVDGQVVIEKNGVRYNILGSEIK